VAAHLKPAFRRIIVTAIFILAVYGLLAYIVLPAAWTHYEHQKGLAGRPMVTRTAQGIPGDALNVGLVGSREDVIRAMHDAGWYPADPITLKTSIEIVGSVLLDRSYKTAPVSPLYYEGRKEDFAFEKPDGKSADRRHHVRFWQVLDKGEEGRPVWLGAVTFDRGVGLSHYTGQVTHHIAPDIDAERDGLIADLTKAGMVTAIYQVTGVGPRLNGRNGEGDFYFTDGEIWIARLVVDGKKIDVPPVTLDSPALVELKDALWRAGETAARSVRR
jgi:hypothetical protein